MRRGAVFVALGLLTTFVVSVCCSLFLPLGDRHMLLWPQELEGIVGAMISKHERPGSQAWMGSRIRQVPGASPSANAQAPPRNDEVDLRLRGALDPKTWPQGTGWVMIAAHGWPMHAMGYRLVDASGRIRSRQWVVVSGIALAEREFFSHLGLPQPVVLGLEPLWAGFAINSLFYSALWALLVIGVPRFVAWLRRHVHDCSARSVVTLIAVTLPLGAATSIAVALFIAYVVAAGGPEFDLRRSRGEIAEGKAWEGHEWSVRREPWWGGSDFTAYRLFQTRPSLARFWGNWVPITTLTARWPDHFPVTVTAESIRVAASGWPMPCFEGQATSMGFDPSRNGRHIESSFAVTSNVGLLGYSVIPLKPIWTGLAIDTAFYTVLWSVTLVAIIIGPPRVLRARRLARGVCPRCCYPLCGAARCPECGTEIAAFAATNASRAVNTRAW